MKQNVALLGLAALDAVAANPITRESKATGKVFHLPLTDIHDDYADYQWSGTIQVGTPPQNLTVVFDTGSPLLIIPGPDCPTCQKPDQFDPSLSSTYHPGSGQEARLGFATGGKADPLAEIAYVTGTLNADKVAIAGASVPELQLLLADAYPGAVTEIDADGILGLSPTGSGLNGGGWFWRLAAQGGVLAEPVFSLALNSVARGNTGRLTLGGSDPSLYNGEFQYVGLTSDASDWGTAVQSLSVDGKVLDSVDAADATLDSGTAYVQAPSDDAASDIYAAISGEIKPVGDLGVWGGPCDLMAGLKPELGFLLGVDGGKQLNMTVPGSSFNLGPLQGHEGICQGVILGPGQSGYGGSWIVGSPLLKAYYTLWDHGNRRLGVAELK